MISLILLSAGEGRRFGRKKQFEKLFGKPLFMHSLERLIGKFDETILVLPPEDINLSIPAGVVKVPGGKERQDSVFNALLEAKGDLVVVHDCARPFASLELFLRVCDLGEFEGKIPALPVRDTIKRVAHGMVVETVDRTNLWLSQTPQAFRKRTLLECHFKARNEGFYATDDAQLLERYGYKVGVLLGEPTNIKITYPEDLPLAEAIGRLLGYS
ncbi:2-C-methyl-D-erythritol 4-phosphate cytidylyltransferase [Pampinifervens florentissimum]|uniref:2-C-methyl-D-erythritol 4-phosphate cytidylyltransferase n=1 Tax=Pampinifervens florentissimum TaxID=1632019 RepID=UPI0013B4A021|nr:2-C-methyl-D-erythritol 4-phosphate cytidylyltransferase [Hydrogenobacter sp. T-8]QID33287.1 2-C-methyl-D-erythritol 4-phosphate cytidylyltransferase [Hydrogenobacter sp. T-8]